MTAASRTLHVRCNTWEQVEVFHTRKLRRGKLLSMKVPFQTEVGASVTLGLELPNQVVMAIDGVVQKASPIEGDSKTWIEVELAGFTEEVVAKIRAMASGAELPKERVTGERSPRAPSPTEGPARIPPSPTPTEDLIATTGERQLFQQLTQELRRLRQASVHDVLGVGRGAGPAEIRRGWLQLIRRVHPDLVARHGAPAISHLAEEMTILSNRAYDRLRATLVAEGRAESIGPLLRPTGWIVGLDELDSATVKPLRPPEPPPVTRDPGKTPPPASVQGAEVFELRARTKLAAAEPGEAQEILAAALVVYPRSRPLRSLYYVSSAVAALANGEVMLAVSQLETALAHHEQCSEAALMLDRIRDRGSISIDEVRKIFQ